MVVFETAGFPMSFRRILPFILAATSLLGSLIPANAQTAEDGATTLAALESAAVSTISKVTASSAQTKYPVDRVVDGDAATYWVSEGSKPGDGPTSTAPQWIQFGFNQATVVNKVFISGRQNYGPREGEIQVSGDGKSFRSIKSFTSSGARDMTVIFPSTTVRYLRVVVLRAFDQYYPDAPRNVQISEMHVYGLDGEGKPASWPPSGETPPLPDDWTAGGAIDRTALTIDGAYGQNINGQSFQQDAITSFNGWQYCVYYDAARQVCLARRKLPKGSWQIIRFSDYKLSGNDAHNTITMGICANDGTIHLAFDHHATDLHYRVSQPGVATEPDKVKWSASLFGAITSRLEFTTKKISYPMFLQTPRGDLQIFYRFGGSGAGQWWMVDYMASPTSGEGGWRRTRQIDSSEGVYTDQWGQSSSRSAYPNGLQYDGKGRLHYTWTWRESTQGANHDICYAYSDDGGLTWRNNRGGLINSGDGKMRINLNSVGIYVVRIDGTWSLMNQQAQAVDSQGRVHVVMWHRRKGAKYNGKRWDPSISLYHHYWRDAQGRWTKVEIPSEVGTRPQLLFDASDNAYLIYTTNRNPNIWTKDIYFVDGQICVATATAESGWANWQVTYRHQRGSFLSELLADRPRLKQEGVLSILAQHAPRAPQEATPIRVIDIN